MLFHSPDRHRRKPAAIAAVLIAGLTLPALAATGQGSLFGTTPANPLPPVAIEAAPRVHVAQSQEAAQLAVRIQQLEEQIRLLTGQVEGLQFQLTQMQTLLERQTEDNEFRFQALEGGAGGKTDAAAQPGGVTPSGELPQSPTPAAPAAAAPADPNAPLEQPTIPADPNAVPPEGVVPLPGEVEFDPTFEGGAPMDDLGASQDPLLGTGQEGQVPLGTLSPSELENLGGRPLDRPFDPTQPSAGDAEAQYAAGYEAAVRGDYAFAEEQFRQFIALYPDNPQAAEATNWLGEALLQRGAYDEAADILLTGYQNYPDSPRAPDLLLKLGIALAGAGETETACRTFGEVARRYPELPAAFKTRLADEKGKAKCPA